MHRLLLIPILLLLTSCGAAPTLADARTTVTAGGCWPLAVPTHTPVVPLPGTPPPLATVIPVCTAQPQESTPTPRPTPVPTPRPAPTAQPPAALGGLTRLPTLPGKTTGVTLAPQPNGQRLVVGWVNWGSQQDATGGGPADGQVWVQHQTPDGYWHAAQTLTTAPVNGGTGSLALAWATDTTVLAVWGDGIGAIWQAHSADGGATWTLPAVLTTVAYQAIALARQPDGTLDLLALQATPKRLWLMTRSPDGGWGTPQPGPPGDAFQTAFTTLVTGGDGRVRRIVLAQQVGGLGLWVSDDGGATWQARGVDRSRWMDEVTPDNPALLALNRPDGTALVAAVWSQYSAGGVFAQLSFDGGDTWGLAEQVAQYTRSGDCYAVDGSGLPCGYWPSPAYDAATDRLVVSYVELVRQRVPDRRVRLAARDLTPNGAWQLAITPDAPDAPLPALSDWGMGGRLIGTPDGRHAWALLQDLRNDQDRVLVRPVHLPGLLAEVES